MKNFFPSIFNYNNNNNKADKMAKDDDDDQHSRIIGPKKKKKILVELRRSKFSNIFWDEKTNKPKTRKTKFENYRLTIHKEQENCNNARNNRQKKKKKQHKFWQKM